jgi:hypothetical protein
MITSIKPVTTPDMNQPQPRGACILDIVRCMLLFSNCRELLAAYERIKENFVVLSVKNTFSDPDPPFGYRQILVIVLFTSPTGHKMAVEVQLHLQAYVPVREMLHVYYTIHRCEDWESMKDFVGPERSVFGHFGDTDSEL